MNYSYLRRDIVYSVHRFGVNFFEYFVYKFYNKSAIGRARINNLRIQYGYCQLVNAPNIRELFDNKAKTYALLKDFYKRDLIEVRDSLDTHKLKEFLSKHSDFILKPIKGVHGYGIQIYRNFNQDVELFCNESLAKGAFVVEELIEQAPEMASLHKESINTIRLTTFRVGEDVTIYGAAVRMGTGSAFVDNAGSGGIFCRVNPIYGFIETNARDYKGNEYIFHPDSNIRFVGFDIPEWEKLKEIATGVAKVIKGATVIAWDFAMSSKGWVVLEANDVGGPDLVQEYEMGNKPVLWELIDKYYKYNKVAGIA